MKINDQGSSAELRRRSRELSPGQELGAAFRHAKNVRKAGTGWKFIVEGRELGLSPGPTVIFAR
jgi:hypothetical protein